MARVKVRPKSEYSQRRAQINPPPKERASKSKFGRYCDVKFYRKDESQKRQQKKMKKSVPDRDYSKNPTYGFTSGGRQSKCNFRFPLKKCEGEFIYNANYSFGKQKKPEWSFAKAEKYDHPEVVEYQICQKHPFAQSQQGKNRCSTTSLKQSCKEKMFKSSSFISTNQMSQASRNYSILGPRGISPVNFYRKSKINHPFYLSRQNLIEEEQKVQQQQKKSKSKEGKGYVSLRKKSSRPANVTVKGFQVFLETYKHQKQFNNYEQKSYPTTPSYHIDFSKQLSRKRKVKPPVGDGLTPKIDFTRVIKSKVNLSTEKYREKIVTRYDRADPEPNTWIDNFIDAQKPKGMVPMGKILDRSSDLFPIVDPAIKKAGDEEMKSNLRQQIPKKQVNEALKN